MSTLMYLINFANNKEIDEDITMVNAVNEAAFNIEEVNLNIWGEYMPKYLSQAEMKAITTEIVETIGLNNDYIESFVEEDDRRVYSINKKGAYSNTTIQLIEMIEHIEENTYRANNYILINISLTNKESSIAYYKEIIKKKLEEMNISNTANVTITAKCSQEVTTEESKKIMAGIVKKMNGKIFEQYYTSDIKSVYAYSSNMEDYIITKGEKMNMDIAITYNEIEDTSYLYLAYPIITIDY
jgi:uncharacterized protein YqeY